MGIHPLYWLNQLACGQGFRLLETTEGEVRELHRGYPSLFLCAVPLAMGVPLISTQCPHCKSYEGLLGSPTWAELELLPQDQSTHLPSQVLKEMICQPKILYLVKISFNNTDK